MRLEGARVLTDNLGSQGGNGFDPKPAVGERGGGGNITLALSVGPGLHQLESRSPGLVQPQPPAMGEGAINRHFQRVLPSRLLSDHDPPTPLPAPPPPAPARSRQPAHGHPPAGPPRSRTARLPIQTELRTPLRHAAAAPSSPRRNGASRKARRGPARRIHGARRAAPTGPRDPPETPRPRATYPSGGRGAGSAPAGALGRPAGPTRGRSKGSAARRARTARTALTCSGAPGAAAPRPPRPRPRGGDPRRVPPPTEVGGGGSAPCVRHPPVHGTGVRAVCPTAHGRGGPPRVPPLPSMVSRGSASVILPCLFFSF